MPPASPAKGKAAKGKAAAAKGKAAIAKGVAEAAAASTDSQKGTRARKGFPAVESIKGLRLGDSAERGKSGGMPYACQLYADLVWCCLPCTEAHVVDNLLEVCVQFLVVNVWKTQRQQLSIGSFSNMHCKPCKHTAECSKASSQNHWVHISKRCMHPGCHACDEKHNAGCSDSLRCTVLCDDANLPQVCMLSLWQSLGTHLVTHASCTA